MNTGQKIRKIRELKGYDQKYMASVLGINQSNYSRIENGTTAINKEQINKVAQALDVTPEYIEAFDDKVIFQNCNHGSFGNFGGQNTYNGTSQEERKAFQDLLKAKDDIIKSKDDYIQLLLDKSSQK